MEQIRKETVEQAIEQVKKKIKDAQDAAAEAARLEAGQSMPHFTCADCRIIVILCFDIIFYRYCYHYYCYHHYQ